MSSSVPFPSLLPLHSPLDLNYPLYPPSSSSSSASSSSTSAAHSSSPSTAHSNHSNHSDDHGHSHGSGEQCNHNHGHGSSHDDHDDHHGHSHSSSNLNSHSHSHGGSSNSHSTSPPPSSTFVPSSASFSSPTYRQSSQNSLNQQHSNHAHNHDDHHGHSHGSTSGGGGGGGGDKGDHGHSHGGHDDHGHAHNHDSHDNHDDHDDHHGHSHGSSSSKYAPIPAHLHAPSSIASISFFSFVPPMNSRSLSLLFSSIYSHPDSRRVGLYLSLKVLFMCLQFLYGLTINVNGISASFHTGFDCAGVFLSLLTMLYARAKPILLPHYSYGYDRFEIVSAFTNSIFLLFTALFLVIEMFHTMYTPPEMVIDEVTMNVIALAIDGCGLVMLYKWRVLKQIQQGDPIVYNNSSNSNSSGKNENVSDNVGLLGNNVGGGLIGNGSSSYNGGKPNLRGHDINMHSVFLYTFADAIEHISTLAATFLSSSYSLNYLHTLSYACTAIIISRTCTTLFQTTAVILLQTTDESIRIGVERCIREISFHDGVLECRSSHWWTNTPGHTVGSLHIRVRGDANEQQILTYVHSLLGKYVTDLTVQIEKDLPMNWIMQTGGS